VSLCVFRAPLRSGNANKRLNQRKTRKKASLIQNAENIDWEEITKDKEGNYI
jgi:hypothetical protein